MERNEIIAILIALTIAAWQARKRLIKTKKTSDTNKQSDPNYWV